MSVVFYNGMYSSMRQTLNKEPRLIMTRTSPPATWSCASAPRSVTCRDSAANDLIITSKPRQNTSESDVKPDSGRSQRRSSTRTSLPLEVTTLEVTRPLTRPTLTSGRESPLSFTPRATRDMDDQIPTSTKSNQRQISHPHPNGSSSQTQTLRQPAKNQAGGLPTEQSDVKNSAVVTTGEESNWTLQPTPIYRGISSNYISYPGPNMVITSHRAEEATRKAREGSAKVDSNMDALKGYRVYKGKTSTDIISEAKSIIRDSEEILNEYRSSHNQSNSRYQKDDRQTKNYGGLPRGPRSPRPQPQLLYTRGGHGQTTHERVVASTPDLSSDTRTTCRSAYQPWWKNPKLKDDWSKPRVVTCSASLTGKPRISSYPSPVVVRLTDRAGSEPPSIEAPPVQPLTRRELSNPSLYRFEPQLLTNYGDAIPSAPASPAPKLESPTPNGSRSSSPQPKSILKNSNNSSPRTTPPRSMVTLRPRRSRSASGPGRGSRYDLATSRSATPRRKSVTFNNQVEMSVGGHVFNLAALHPQVDL